MTRPIHQALALDQSIRYDGIRRSLLASGRTRPTPRPPSSPDDRHQEREPFDTFGHQSRASQAGPALERARRPAGA